MVKPRTDDAVFQAAKTKLASAIETCSAKDVAKLCKLVDTLVRVRALELKGDDEGWGASLNPEQPPP